MSVERPSGVGSRRFSIRWKLLLTIALPVVVVYVAMILGVLVHLGRKERRAVERRMTETAQRHAQSFDAALRELAQVARSTASFLETADGLRRDQFEKQLRANLAASPLCYGSAVAFAPGAYEEELELFGPYAFRQGETMRFIDIATDAYDYTLPQWEWYDRPRRTGTPGWTAPYFDEGAGNVLMSTYAAPFFDGDDFAGVTTVDIALEPLRQSVGAAIPARLEFFVITGSGQFVYHPDPELIMESSIFAKADNEGREDLRSLGEAMTAGGSGVRAIETTRGADWVVFAPIRSPGWSLAVRVSERAALAPVRADVRWLALVLGATLLLIGLSIVMASGWITQPLVRLTRTVRDVAGGDLDAEAPGGERADEIGQLTRSFNQMRDDLKGLMEQRADEQAAGRDALIFSLAKLAESRDSDTGKHLERICRYVEILAGELARERDDIDDQWISTITRTAALHDIGKVGIPDAVLCKPGKLTDEEYRVIKKHTTIGGDTLLAIKQRYEDDAFLRTATEIAFAHHERWDGGGYPFGLSRDDIALSARIVSVADVYDALTSKRVYKPPLSHDEASRIIVEGSGTQFDPAVVAAFERVADRMRTTAEELGEE